MFAGTVTDKGHVKPDQVNATRGRLARWKGRRVTVTVTRYIKSKTNPQLGLYFRFGGLLDAWCDYIGDERRAVHHDLKEAFLRPIIEESPEPTRVNKITGEETPKELSLADLNVEQMSAYMDRVIREGAHLGIVFDLSEVG